MISELVTLEYYFGRIEAVMTLEELIKKFGSEDVCRAIHRDEIEVRRSVCSLYGVLTEKARHHAPVTGTVTGAVTGT